MEDKLKRNHSLPLNVVIFCDDLSFAAALLSLFVGLLRLVKFESATISICNDIGNWILSLNVVGEGVEGNSG